MNMRAYAYVTAVAAACLLSTSAHSFECSESPAVDVRVPGVSDAKFKLATAACATRASLTNTDVTEASFTRGADAFRPMAASELSEQLKLYEQEIAYAAVAEARPLFASAVAAVLVDSKPRRQGGKPTRAFADLVRTVALTHDIDPDFLHAIMEVESRANPKAVSHAGARGLMQVMPATARRFGVRNPLTELHDPEINLNVSAVYLKKLQKLFGNDLRLVLAGYNAGEGAVMKYGNRVPPYRETQNYVRTIGTRYGSGLHPTVKTYAPTKGKAR